MSVTNRTILQNLMLKDLTVERTQSKAFARDVQYNTESLGTVSREYCERNWVTSENNDRSVGGDSA